jgi:hypothetical protein
MHHNRSRWDGFRCMDCGYDLSCIDSDACPECGHVLIPGGFDIGIAQGRAAGHARLLLSLCGGAVFLSFTIGLLADFEGASFTLGFAIIYGVVATLFALVVYGVSGLFAERHTRSRARAVWRCCCGWCYWPGAVIPLGLVLGTLTGSAAAAAVILAAVSVFGVAAFVVNWRDAARLMHLPLTTPALLVQVGSLLGAATLGIFLFLLAQYA